jgi:hypothetical protein
MNKKPGRAPPSVAISLLFGPFGGFISRNLTHIADFSQEYNLPVIFAMNSPAQGIFQQLQAVLSM